MSGRAVVDAMRSAVALLPTETTIPPSADASDPYETGQPDASKHEVWASPTRRWSFVGGDEAMWAVITKVTLKGV